ncbi:hypothetical protein J4422_00465 [Candidatus Pacearchaeota archaeon]|nr:hypothetical protein [Candidatus Pacearchaeota archaeon]
MVEINLEPGRWFALDAELREVYGNPEISNGIYMGKPQTARVYGNDVILNSNEKSDLLVICDSTPTEIKSKLVKLATKL